LAIVESGKPHWGCEASNAASFHAMGLTRAAKEMDAAQDMVDKEMEAYEE
jgi:hypothetical protein